MTESIPGAPLDAGDQPAAESAPAGSAPEKALAEKLDAETATQILELTGADITRLFDRLRARAAHYGVGQAPIDELAEIVRAAFFEAQPMRFFEALAKPLGEMKDLVDDGFQGPVTKRGIRFS